MANTYTKLYIQYVFAVKGRDNMIPKQHKEQVHQYMNALLEKRKHKLLQVHCMPDHCHLFVGLDPAQSISSLIEEVKTATTKFIKKQAWMPSDFSWQKGFGAFSYSQSHIDAVVKYIQNQERHHQKRSFKSEYLELLKKFEVDFDERYLFDFYDDL
jgi:putative transposase